MAKKLETAGVQHQLITAPGKGHGFEVAGLDDPSVADALGQMLSFLKKHLR